jgi:hypothetical protein
MLFEATASDPVTFPGMLVVLGSVSAIAVFAGTPAVEDRSFGRVTVELI